MSNRGVAMNLFDLVRHRAPLIRMHDEFSPQRRKCALVAVGPLADPATDADRHSRTIQPQPLGVDDLVRVCDLAPDAEPSLEAA